MNKPINKIEVDSRLELFETIRILEFQFNHVRYVLKKEQYLTKWVYTFQLDQFIDWESAIRDE